jgi:hypothetical protein
MAWYDLDRELKNLDGTPISAITKYEEDEDGNTIAGDGGMPIVKERAAMTFKDAILRGVNGRDQMKDPLPYAKNVKLGILVRKAFAGGIAQFGSDEIGMIKEHLPYTGYAPSLLEHIDREHLESPTQAPVQAVPDVVS